jgi:chitinase
MAKHLNRAFLLLTFLIISRTVLSQPGKINVIAYFTGRPTQLDSFDAKKITHIIFSFGHLRGGDFHIRNAVDTVIIQKMISLKTINPQLKVMLSLGGWGGCETCSDVFAIKKNRKAFAKSVKEHLAYFKADGIDLDWEYPAVADLQDISLLRRQG